MKVFGVIPAAGKGTRLSPLPFSKEMFPVGFMDSNDKLCPRPVSHYLLEAFKRSEINEIFWITSENKTDIQRYYRSGANLQMNFCYLQQEEPKGMVDAIRYISPWLPKNDDYLIALGMPDTLFYPTNLFLQMKQQLLTHPHIDVVLGLFQTEQWHKLGMVEWEKEKDIPMVKVILDKPKSKPKTDFAWGTAMWRSSFHSLLNHQIPNMLSDKEYTLSDAINLAIEKGLHVGAVMGDDFIDIGTIEDLQKTIELTNRKLRVDPS